MGGATGLEDSFMLISGTTINWILWNNIAVDTNGFVYGKYALMQDWNTIAHFWASSSATGIANGLISNLSTGSVIL